MKPVTDESLTLLFCALSGSPIPGSELTEAEREAREKRWLQELCLWEIREYAEGENSARLAEAFGLRISSNPAPGVLVRLRRALVG